MPDIRKPLSALREEWEGCTKCELGTRRLEVGGSFVFGEGEVNGVMFIGEGPGVNEEEYGRPFIGESGKLLRDGIQQAGINQYYISNVVACRSCEQAYDNAGQPVFRYNRYTKVQEPKIIDRPPTTTQLQACLPRIHEEIYLVDPLLIVGLGGEACKILLGGKAVTITKETGVPRTIEVPGAAYNPILTEKKKVWRRKIKGEWRMPVAQNMVRYLMIPLIHPAYALRFSEDQRHGSPMHNFALGLQLIKRIYDRMIQETYNRRNEHE